MWYRTLIDNILKNCKNIGQNDIILKNNAYLWLNYIVKADNEGDSVENSIHPVWCGD